MNDFVVLIRGQSTNVQQQKEAWKGFDVLFSAWIGEEENYTDANNALFNTPPSTPGPGNFHYQIVSSINGLLKAKELGYKNVLNIRSDIIPTNVNRFIDSLDENKLNFLCWHRHEAYPGCSGYLVDYVMCGPIDYMIKLWNISNTICGVSEINLTWQYINSCKDIDINYFINELNDENDLWWLKYNKYLSSYKMHVGYTTDTMYLDQSYANFLNN